MIKCIAIDDEPLSLKLIETFIGETPSLQLIKKFTDPFAAMDFLKHEKADLLFLDIQMPELNGIQLFESIKEPPPVVFTTAFSQYAIDGFNLDAVDYLLKPFDYDRFLKAVNKANEYIGYSKGDSSQHRNEDYIFLKSEYQLVKVEFNDVLYVESLDDYIKIITSKSHKPILSLIPLKTLMEKLPASKFVRVHRSFIVPFAKIENVRNKRIRIREKYIPIGDNFSGAFFKALSSFQ